MKLILNTVVSVVVCTTGRNSLEDCLKSLETQTYEGCEIVIVAFDPKVEEVVSKFNGFKFFLSEEAGASKQRNMGIKNATGEIVAFIDDDAIADKNWIAELAKHYEDKNVACVGGRIVPKFLGEVPKILKDLPPGIFKGFIGETLIDSEEPIEISKPLLWASNLSFRKTIFDEVGYFDERLGRSSGNLAGGEEVEIQKRIIKNNLKIVYEPKAMVTHIVGSERLTKPYFIKRSFWQGYSEVMEVRDSEDFENLWKNESQKKLFKYLNLIKFNELIFEMIGSSSFKDNVDVAKKIGRTAAFLSLLKG